MTLAEKLEPPQILGPLSPKNQENYTVPLGGQTTLQCAVRSLGPTQIQWLKQLHDHQAPTDRNRTIVVFDFIFEVSISRSLSFNNADSKNGFYTPKCHYDV